MNSTDIIKKLNLSPLEPEGGYFRQSFKSEANVRTENGYRPTSTAIYYLVTRTSFSKFHSLKSTEIYHFYSGDPLHLFLLHPNGTQQSFLLGSDVLNGQIPQVVVPPGVWQGSYTNAEVHGYSLVGTTCSPGFEYIDFVLADRGELLKTFPNEASLIEKLV